MPYVCPLCHSALDPTLTCTACAARFSIADGIADFSGGHYYDSFDSGTILTAEQQAGLEAEVEGSFDRIESFYVPLLPQRRGARVLDSGCGNGLSIEALASHGYEAWGHDLSQLRRHHWLSRPMRERLCVADGRRLPFATGFFDAVLSSGVIEHIGVEESRIADAYSVAPQPERDRQRVVYLRELLRVTKKGGVIFLDFPNGLFPIDFWHGGPRQKRDSIRDRKAFCRRSPTCARSCAASIRTQASR